MWECERLCVCACLCAHVYSCHCLVVGWDGFLHVLFVNFFCFLIWLMLSQSHWVSRPHQPGSWSDGWQRSLHAPVQWWPPPAPHTSPDTHGDSATQTGGQAGSPGQQQQKSNFIIMISVECCLPYLFDDWKVRHIQEACNKIKIYICDLCHVL